MTKKVKLLLNGPSLDVSLKLYLHIRFCNPIYGMRFDLDMNNLAQINQHCNFKRVEQFIFTISTLKMLNDTKSHY
jgi:hypothetical protein